MPVSRATHYQGTPRFDDGDKAPVSIYGNEGETSIALDAAGNPASWMQVQSLLAHILAELQKMNIYLESMTNLDLTPD